MTDKVIDFLTKHIGFHFKLNHASEKTWFASIDDENGHIIAIMSGETSEQAIQKAISEAEDVLTITPSHLILVPTALMKDEDGYFQMHTQKDVDLGPLSIKELKNYATWDRKFWSYVHNGFVFHCGPVLHKERDSNLYHSIQKVFKS